jgi:hypothetical protein
MNYTFDIEVAKKHGVDAAIMIENFRFWIAKNKANKKHFYKNRYWTYNSVKAFAELFPFWTERQLQRIIKNLEDSGVLLSDNFNDNPYNRTKWYTLNELSISLDSKSHLTERVNENNETVKSLIYTDINTDNKPDINFTPAKAVVKTKINWLIILVNDYQISEDIAEQFIQYRKDKKATISKIVLNNLIEQSQILNITLDEAIKTMIINNWAGFKADWVKNQNAKNAGYTKPDTSFAAHQASCERQIANIEKFAPKQQQQRPNDNDNEIIDGDFMEIL